MREGYVGLNNRKAGRTAAWMIAKTSKRPGKVAVFVGSHRFHGQEMREIGFRTYFREYAPEFELVETMVNLEARRIAHEATLDLLQRYPIWPASMSRAAAWRARSLHFAMRTGRPHAVVATSSRRIARGARRQHRDGGHRHADRAAVARTRG